MASLSPKTSILGRRLAAHLLRRTTFRITKERIDAFAVKTPSVAVAELLVPGVLTMSEPVEAMTGTPWLNVTREPETDDFKLKGYIRAWFLHEALMDPSIYHKMIFFFHAHLVTNSNDTDSYSFWDHLSLIHKYALGNYKKLCTKMAVDMTMLVYLNNVDNYKENPNENFARENFELFTVSKGPQIGPGNYTNYTEQDIQEAARVMTGFTWGDRALDKDLETGISRGNANMYNHDSQNKLFSAAFQNTVIQGTSTSAGMWTELQAFYDMIFNQLETSKHIVRRLYRYLVGKNLTSEIESDIIGPLALTLKNNNFNISTVLSQLLNSKHFYDEDDSTVTDEFIGSIIKSPLDLVLPSFSFFKIFIPPVLANPVLHYEQFYCDGIMHNMLEPGGMDIFSPVNVAGYAAYYQAPGYSRSWFNGGSIYSRYKLGTMLIAGETLYGGDLGTHLDIVTFTQQNITAAETANNVVKYFTDYLFAETPSTERYDYFLKTVFLKRLSATNWRIEWQKYLSTGVSTEVIIPLSNLVASILSSPEYQLM